MPLPSTIDLEILVPAPDRKITLHAVAAQESATDKVLFATRGVLPPSMEGRACPMMGTLSIDFIHISRAA